ncbi:hypothetical protein [Cryobacterium sp.]|uniref:hypothetical protein n=1 Tax=Cryobacterium sp. TaxID=1926290 RepID=UPI0026290298|nr:hypothetical protein [Cryobacterium sp.]MCU1446171.1 hypothetical protein [Cryobacterium sp.]
MRNNDGSVVAEAQRENDPYRQALDDPAFLTAVGAVYRGRLAVLDALWWEAHPDDPAPDGRPAPVERLRALQRRVFAADGDAAGDRAVAEALLELQADIAAERSAIGAAIDAARAGIAEPPGGAAAPAAGPSAGPEPDAAGPWPSPETLPEKKGSGLHPHGRVLVAAGLAGAVLLGALLGSNVTTAVNSAGGEPPATTASDPTPTDDQSAQVGRVFDRIQTARDIPLVPMPETFDPESFRYLGSAGWTDRDADGLTDSPYYAARGANGTVCLVVVPEGSGYLSTCAIEAAYPGSGLHLFWQSTDLHPTVPAGAEAVVLDITVAWLSDATIQTRGSGRTIAGP